VTGSIGGVLLGGIAAALLFALLRRPKQADDPPRLAALRISEPIPSNVRGSFNPDRRPSAMEGPGGASTTIGDSDYESPSVATFQTDETSERRSSVSPRLIGRWTGKAVVYRQVENPRVEGTGYLGLGRIAPLDLSEIGL